MKIGTQFVKPLKTQTNLKMSKTKIQFTTISRALALMVTILLVAFLISCKEEEPPAPEEPPAEQEEEEEERVTLQSLAISNFQPFTVFENEEAVQFSFAGIGSDGKPFSNLKYDLFVNGENIGSKFRFTPEEPGIYEVYAASGDIVSNTVSIDVREQHELEKQEFNLIFHIMHDGESIGEGYNIPYEKISYQMSLLNLAFGNDQLTANSSSPNFTFKLAETDPEGNPLEEPGVVRSKRPSRESSILFEEWMWDHYWDPDDYINIWIGDTKNGYSWGIYPNVTCDMDIIPDGIYCLDNPQEVTYLTGIALELDNLWEGNMVFPHEMGHIFGLFHVFNQDGCNSDADFCKDTFQYHRGDYEANQPTINRVSCEFDHDFVSYNTMDYWAQPSNQRDFSYDQVARMRLIVERGYFIGNNKFVESVLPKQKGIDLSIQKDVSQMLMTW